MTVTATLTIAPDAVAVTADLTRMTARWGELKENAFFELRALAENRKERWDQFTPVRMAEAVAWAIDQNDQGFNIYAVRNPIRMSHRGAATDASILAALECWADCDTPDAASNVKRFDGPKWTHNVITGQHPATRVHVYWELVEPVYDLTAWRETQVAIAAHFHSDPSVINPSRIMRVAGTVSHPNSKKRARGYEPELCTLRTEYEDAREPVPFERLQRVFAPYSPSADATGGFRIDTGTDTPRDAAAYEDILRRARTDGEKHTGVRDLAASLAGQGVTRSMAEAIIREACPVWDANVESLINSAYTKYFKPEPLGLERPATAYAEPEDHPDIRASGVTVADLTGIRPRPWLYGRKLVRGFVSVLASPGGIGKSAWITAAACDMAAGVNTLHDRPHRPLRVWLYNLEDPRDETLRKIAAVLKLKHYSVPVLPNLFVNSGRDRRLILAEEPKPRLIIARPDVQAIIAELIDRAIDVLTVDPFVRSHLLGENDNKSIDFVMDLYAQIASEANCAVLLIHHTRKGFVNGDSDSIRGGSAMSSAARVALTMQTMCPEEAKLMSVSDAERRFLIRIDGAKSNLAPPAVDAEWVKLVSQPLDNGSEEYPDGDFVQVVTPWAPPDAWDGIGQAKANEILDLIAFGFTTENGATEKYSSRSQDDRWAGHAIMAAFPDGNKSHEQCKQIIKIWIENEVLAEVEYMSATQRKMRRGLEVRQRPGADQ